MAFTSITSFFFIDDADDDVEGFSFFLMGVLTVLMVALGSTVSNSFGRSLLIGLHK